MLYTLLFSALITLVITIIQLFLDYENGIENIDNQFSLVESSYVATLNGSLWVYDSKQVNLQLEGILNLEDIAYSEIKIHNKTEYQAGNPNIPHKVVKEFPIFHLYDGKKLNLGTLIIYADLNNLYDFLKKKVIVVLISQAIKTFLISFLILYLFQILVNRHLETIANFLSDVDPSKKNQRLKLSKKNSDDELDQLSSAINTMQDSLYSTYQALNSELVLNTQMKDEIKESQENLIHAQKIAKLGSWEWSQAKETLYASEEFFEILKIERDYRNALTLQEISDLLDSGMEFPLFSMLVDGDLIKTQDNEIMTIVNNELETSYIKSNLTTKHHHAHNMTTMVGTIQDITAEHLTHLENTELLFAINESPLLILITDKNGQIEYINKSVYKLFPNKSKNLMHHSIATLLTTHDTSIYEEAFKEADKEGIWEADLKDGDNIGKSVIMKTIITPIRDDSNRTQKFTIWKEDVTQAKDLNRKFLLQSRHAQMGEMIAMIAHQWRQPLSNISSLMSGLLIKSELNKLDKESVKKANDNISEQVKHLSQTISDFSNFFKPNKTMDYITFNHLIQKVDVMLGNLFKVNDITITNNIPDEIGIETYSNELLQVVLNLMKNSVDAFLESSKDGRYIHIDLSHQDGFVSFHFKDNAGGIQASVLENIFTPYFSTKSEKNGTGLGLYMSKTIIEKHMDGQLNVKSKGDTTTFTLSFPSQMIKDTSIAS